MANSNVIKCPQCGTPHIPRYSGSFSCSKCPYQSYQPKLFKSYDEIVRFAGSFYTPLQITRLCLPWQYTISAIHNNGDENEFVISMCCASHANMNKRKFQKLFNKIRNNDIFELPDNVITEEQFWNYVRQEM